MALLRTEPNVYVENAVPYSTTTGSATGVGVALDFCANQLHVYNDRASAVFLALGTSAPSSAMTAQHKTCAGESLVIRDVLLSRFSLYCTATATGTIVRCLAVGA